MNLSEAILYLASIEGYIEFRNHEMGFLEVICRTRTDPPLGIIKAVSLMDLAQAKFHLLNNVIINNVYRLKLELDKSPNNQVTPL
jgi:hypothetical protein